MRARSFDIISLGEALIEFNQTSSKQLLYLQGFGGDTSNAVIAAARAGARTAYLTRVGTDRFGDALLHLWADEGVDTRYAARDSHHPTGIYFVHHTEQGHAFSYRRAGSAASRMTADSLQASSWFEAIGNTQCLLVSGISLAISSSARETVLKAMNFAQQSQALVALDSNLRLQLWDLATARTTLSEAVSLCDIFLPSLEDMEKLIGISTPEDIVAWSHQRGAKSVVLKLGANGALVSNGSSQKYIPGRQVELVDATGAGDCFCGNLLARLVMGDDLFQAAHYANVAASVSVQGFGAVAPLPTQAQVTALCAATIN